MGGNQRAKTFFTPFLGAKKYVKSILATGKEEGEDCATELLSWSLKWIKSKFIFRTGVKSDSGMVSMPPE